MQVFVAAAIPLVRVIVLLVDVVDVVDIMDIFVEVLGLKTYTTPTANHFTYAYDKKHLNYH